MNDRLLSIYYLLPAPLKSVAASLRGLYLRSWRYGRETECLIQQAFERERWDRGRWKAWQEERLVFILNRAARRVPYYREQWAARRRNGDNASWEYLENWPILDKETLRQRGAAFLADDCDKRMMFHEHTSGTTGKSLNLWWSRETVRLWYALFEARCRRWYGVSKQDRWAILGGQLVTAVGQQQPPFWVWNLPLNQLYMSSYHLGPDLIPYYLEALNEYGIKYVFGYSSSLYALAQEILRMRRTDLQMTVVITNAEPLLDYQRTSISEAFQCPVRETYGMAEIVAAASECNEGSLHFWPEVGAIEVFEKGQVGEARGDLICTGLLNPDMPLIRYKVGDYGVLGSDDARCACGRLLPLLTSLEGRIDDLLYTQDGRRIGRLDPVFKDQISVREAQIIQESMNRVRVRYVPALDFTPDKANLLIRRLQERMGPVEVVLDETAQIPRTSNGKFQSVVCRIPYEERNA